MKTLEERFLTKIEKRGPDDCWLWTASKFRGYGKIGRGRKGSGWMYAHQAAWLIYRGPMPEGLEIDHLCHNRACANPSHLEAVTHAENMKRQLRAISPTCARGHEYGDRRSATTGRRDCLECARIRWKRKNEKQRQAHLLRKAGY